MADNQEWTQGSIFELPTVETFKIDKPIRLIELFAGYGSQALALKYLGANFESWKIAEWAVKSIQAYKDLHKPDDNTDYSKDLTDEQVFNELLRLGISADYSTPMDLTKIKRLGAGKARQVYNNIKATNNLVSVCNIHGDDLEIVDTDKYTYIMTFSSPCQDVSNAGKREGFAKGCGTRSGLLWEVERILYELKDSNKELPQVLLMENVSAILQDKNYPHFLQWVESLKILGYNSCWKVLNTKDFNVPQNRERCFMVSLLSDKPYNFPIGGGCKLKLKDLLEKEVDEKYFIPPQTVKKLIAHKQRNEQNGNSFGWNPSTGGGLLTVLQQKQGTDQTQTLLLNRTGMAKQTEVAGTLMARDYKGFGNQPMTAVAEFGGQLRGDDG